MNPIQDGANRGQLDQLLRDVSARGVWVSAHPDVIGQMGTKEVLFCTRGLGCGRNTDLYRSRQELAEALPDSLQRDGRLVLKQARGNGDNGVWRLDLVQSSVGASASPSADAAESVTALRDADEHWQGSVQPAAGLQCRPSSAAAQIRVGPTRSGGGSTLLSP